MGPIVCKKRHYLVLSQLEEGTGRIWSNDWFGRGTSKRGDPQDSGGIWIDDWLNHSLPWVWRRKVTHLRATTDTVTQPNHLGGPEETEMYVQRIPAPDELWSVPSGDFDKIDKCVLQRMVVDLDGKDY